MSPQIGSIFNYILNEQDVKKINNKRKVALKIADLVLVSYSDNTQLVIDDPVCPGDVLPMIVVRKLETTDHSVVNGLVFLDGGDTYWVKAVSMGNQPGNYNNNIFDPYGEHNLLTVWPQTSSSLIKPITRIPDNAKSKNTDIPK